MRVSPPGLRHADPPSPTATVDELEARADQLRGEKAYLDALDYYRAAISKDGGNARLHNKAGISQLMLQRYKDAEKNFERAVKLDRSFADAYNNLGVILYEEKKFPKAIKTYEKAIGLRQDSASFYNNLGAAYYMRKEWAQATDAYGRALQLDPDIFGRISHSGVSAQIPSPEERARFDYLVAKLYAKQGDPRPVVGVSGGGWRKAIQRLATFIKIRSSQRFETIAIQPVDGLKTASDSGVKLAFLAACRNNKSLPSEFETFFAT